jgi:hypothetical protein
MSLVNSKIAQLMLILALFQVPLEAQRFDKFGADNISYPHVKTLYGIIPTNHIESTLIKDTIYYNIYLWVPDSVGEINIRMVSAVPRFVFPNKGESITEDYPDPPDTGYHKYFIPEFRFEKSLKATRSEEAFTKSGQHHWKLIGLSEYISGATLHQADVQNTALLNLKSGDKNKTRITEGLYRIQFRGIRESNPEGTFLLQIGVNKKIPGLKLFRSQLEL